MFLGLIHNAIAQSGTAFSNWALSPNDQGRRNSKKLAEVLNCPTSSTIEMTKCLKEIKDPMKFVEKDDIFMVRYSSKIN